MRILFRYPVALLLLAFVAGSLSLDAQQLDSARREALDRRIFEYFDILKYESIDVDSDMFLAIEKELLERLKQI